jgi:hypothetical protein
MSLRFTEQTALELVGPHLFPAEQLLHRLRGVEMTRRFGPLSWLASLFGRCYLVVATNQRVLFIEHGGMLSGYRERSVTSLAWPQIAEIAVSERLWRSTLHVRAPAVGLELDLSVGRGSIPNNAAECRRLAATWRPTAAPRSEPRSGTRRKPAGPGSHRAEAVRSSTRTG